MSQLANLKKAKDLVLQEIRRVGGPKLVAAAFKEFFAANPDNAMVTWEQYTPGFDDSNYCVFTVGCFRGFYAGTGNTGLDPDDSNFKALREFEEAVSDDELFKEALGSEVEVTVTPKELTIKNYSGY